MRKGVWYGLLTLWYGLLTGLALLLAACGGGVQPQQDLTLAPQPDLRSGSPDFTISLSSNSVTVQQGASSQITLTVTPRNRFTGPVILALVPRSAQDQVPRGLTLSPGGVRVSGRSPVNQSLTLSAQSNTPRGNYNLSVQATSTARRFSRAADLTVQVTGS